MNPDVLEQLIPSVAGKLGAEEITKYNYSLEKGKHALSNCVLASKLIRCLEIFEQRVFSELEPVNQLI